MKNLPYAADYPDCLKIVEEKVKPERDKLGLKKDSSAQGYAKYWWLYGRRALELYEAIAGRDQVLVRSRVAKINSIAFVPTGIVMSEAIVVFNFDDYASFVLLQAMAHTEWLTYHASSMRTDIRYTPSDCFETFPFPELITNLEQIGETYYTHRQNIMLSRQEGLTKTYNRFHNPQETDADIVRLRQLHVEMDYAVAAAYGWNDLLRDEDGRMKDEINDEGGRMKDENNKENSSLIPHNSSLNPSLQHDFHATKQGLRYTISETARREVLDRLLQLNHQRYREEVEQGLHDKKKKKAKSGSKRKAKIDTSLVQGELF